jgi:succinate dehydrogenase/fumarate reductase flavoprotein subunit
MSSLAKWFATGLRAQCWQPQELTLYQRNENPSRTNGDGYALANRVGASLIGMEFVQIYPLGIVEKGFPCIFIPNQWTDFCPVSNNHGEQFVLAVMARQRYEYGWEVNFPMRKLAARQIALEVHHGPGDQEAVLMDFSHIRTEHLAQNRNLRLYVAHLFRDFRYREQSLHVAPLAHHMMGGVQSDEQGITTVPGFFAAGEVTGGVHVANRRGENALTDIVVFGRRPGRAAVACVGHAEIQEPDKQCLLRVQDRLARFSTSASIENTSLRAATRSLEY